MASPPHTPKQSISAFPPSQTPQSSTRAEPPQVPAQSCPKAGNSRTVPSANAANTPNAGSSPVGARKPEANATALPPPSPDKGAVKAAIASLPAGATPSV